MKVRQGIAASDEICKQSEELGALVARLRIARGIKQAEQAVRAGISRNSAYRLEHGDPGVALGQMLRYINAISPGVTLAMLVTESDPSLKALAHYELRKRVRDMSQEELREID